VGIFVMASLGSFELMAFYMIVLASFCNSNSPVKGVLRTD
jgi:hypothetical protein